MRFEGCAATLRSISQPALTVIVHDHWVEARKRHTANGRQVIVRRFGWSVLSAEDAADMARGHGVRSCLLPQPYFLRDEHTSQPSRKLGRVPAE